MASNYDQTEISKFSAMADDWWNPQGKLKTLHDINPLRLNFIEQNTSLKEKSILDVGCGGGILTEKLAKTGAHTTGIDLSEAAIAIAKQHAEPQNLSIDYRVIAIEELAQQQPETYDVLTCMELLEHVPDPAQLISACSLLVKPSGKLFFSTINRNPKAYLYAILGAEYILKLLPQGTHDYTKFIRPSELVNWARNSGLTVEALQGFSYNLLSKEYYLTDDVSVNYLAYCVKN